MNEIKKADEIVRALRIKSDCERFFKETGACADCPMPYKESPNYQRICVGFDEEMLPQAADLIESLTAQLAESQRREKAAVEDINLLEDCGVCKHHDLDSCDLAGTECHFEWRGPQAEKGAADGK